MRPESVEGANNWGLHAGKLHAGILADVMDGFGVWGALDVTITCVNRYSKNVLGRAYTVRWRPTRKSHNIMAAQDPTWSQVKDFLVPEIKAGAGMIYVGGVEGGLLPTYALAGGFSATDVQKRRFEAMVLGGAIRDAHVVKALDMPVWATNFSPLDTQGNYQVAEIGTWCPIGNLVVRTGDWIFGDETGLIVVPAEKADEVFNKAIVLAGTEDDIDRRVASGDNIFDVVAEVGHL